MSIVCPEYNCPNYSCVVFLAYPLCFGRARGEAAEKQKQKTDVVSYVYGEYNFMMVEKI